MAKKVNPNQRYVTKGPGEVVHALSDRLKLRFGVDLFECDITGKLIPRKYDTPAMTIIAGNAVPELEAEPSAKEAAVMAGSPDPDVEAEPDKKPPKKKKK